MAALRSYATEKFEHSLNSKIAKKLEKSIFNFTVVKARKQNVDRSWENPLFKMYYKHKVNNILYNIKHGVLKQKIVNNEFDISSIPYMLSWELWPEKYEEYFQKKLAKEMIQLKQMSEDENTTGLYTCRKCKSKCTTFFSLQTRSADEPMTNYITCKKCGHKWKD